MPAARFALTPAGRAADQPRRQALLPAAGSAQNVGIQILDRTGEVLILDGATFSAKTDLIDGTNILPFQARYIALGQSVAGTANADATFKVQYL